MLPKQQTKAIARTVKTALIGLALALGLLHVFVVVMSVHFGNDLWSLASWFDLDTEWSVPAVYSGILLGCTAFLLLILSAQTKVVVERLRWVFLSVLFFYIAFDEMLVIHEQFAAPVRDFLAIPRGNILYHAWVVVAILIVLLLLTLWLFVHRSNPMSRFQKRVLMYVAILAGGVILLEAIGTQLYFSPLLYKLGSVFIEELFEIGMVSFILYRLTGYAFGPYGLGAAPKPVAATAKK